MTIWPAHDLAELATDLGLPKRVRVNAQRLFLWRERELIVTFPGVNSTRWNTKPGDFARPYLQKVLRIRRQSRRAPEPTPWGALLAEWPPDKRCRFSMAENEAGEAVHHDDPTAARWCLAGWLAHRCMRPTPGRPLERLHRPLTAAETGEREWWALSDDKNAKRLLDEVWALVPEPQRAVAERYRKQRTTTAQRRELVHHPLGYWWQLSPLLAARLLRIEVP